MKSILIIMLVLVNICLTVWQTDTTATMQADITCLLPNEKTLLYTLVERKPLFNGEEDLNKFREWIIVNIRVPREYWEMSFQGTIPIEFIVNRNGDVCNAKIIRSVDKLIDIEILRVVNESPRWQPAVFVGENVSAYITIPVRIGF